MEIAKERLVEMIDSVLAWGADHDEEFKECLVNALDITEEEYEELFGESLDCYLGEDEEEEEDEKELELPEEDTISKPNIENLDELDEYVSNYLSDTYGFCVKSFNFDFDECKLYIYDIKWDTED